MTPRYTTELIDPHRLDAAARATLADALYATHRRIFSGVSRAAFGAYVVDSPADRTRILILRDTQGTARGYAALHVFKQRHLGRPTLIVRMEIGAEPAWRRCGFAGPFIVREALRLAARHPGRPRYFFATFVHPSAYVSLCRHAPRLWPHPDHPTPPHIAAIMQGLQRRFDLESTGSGTVDVGWIAHGCGETPSHLSPEALFYLERNPGYTRGEGLMTLIDFGTPAVIRGSLDYARHHARRQRRRQLGSPQGALGRRLLASG